MTAGHRQIEHTADLAFEAWADSEEALLVEAARALTEVLAKEAPSPERTRTIELDCLDREDRLVCFLNEVIYLAVTEGFVLHSASLQLEGETGLHAEISGSAVPLEGELKAVTYHDLHVEIGNPCRAVFVVDV